MTSVDEPIFMEEETGDSSVRFAVPAKTLYVGAVAEENIDAEMPTLYLDWEVARRLQFESQRSIQIDKEVAGILLGTTSEDNSLIKVSHIAVARDEDSSPVHFKFTYSVWDDLIDQMENLSKEAGEELLLLGWYHTHPNMSVFLSRYDLRTHRDFHRPYQFALVLAPKLGTADTSVGYFVNRGGGTPLLPGLHLFGAKSRREVTAALPWKFQVVEAEGVEEGEGDGDDDDAQDDTPVLHQVGMVRKEAPDWLTLGQDRAEGPVASILEGMASAVVETHQDRIGVLLGAKTGNHVTIKRVRFLGHLGEDPDKERQDLVGALRFMAATFPATGEQKILGVVRIVSPHRFSEGDTYDPVEHNIRIALFLGEVGYDLDEVPFQVGLVLYPGIEEDTLLFQVFAQNKMSRPVPLMSLQAIAPPSLRPNDRWEPIAEPVFTVEREPCLLPPSPVPPSQIGTSAQSARMKELAQTFDDEEPMPAPAGGSAPAPEGTGSGIDWGAMAEEGEEEDEEAPASDRRGLVLVGLLLAALAALVAGLAVLNMLQARQDADPTQSGGDGGPGADVLALGEPYAYTFTGCGAGWNPGIACVPFSDAESESAALLRLQKRDAYAESTIQPIEVWLIAEEGLKRQRLDRSSGGDGVYTFSVQRQGGNWDRLWGAPGEVVDADIIILPQGAELFIDDELSFLRRSESLRIVAPTPLEEEPENLAPGGEPTPDRGGTTSPPAAGSWRWHSGKVVEQATFDTGRNAFANPLEISGGSSTDGTWTLRFRQSRRGAIVATLPIDAGVTADLTRHVTSLMREPAVVEALQAQASGDRVYVEVQPPTGSKLVVAVSLTGTVAASVSTEHKICVMIANPEGAKLEGRARVGDAPMRPTFDPAKGDKGECADGGATGRWSAATVKGDSLLQFVYEGSDGLPSKGVVQKYTIGAKFKGRAAGCYAITVFVDDLGFQAKAPELSKLYGLSGGRCQ